MEMTKTHKFRFKKVICIILFFFSIFILPKLSTAASQGFCNNYAQQSIQQFNTAQNLGIPNLAWPIWSNDYNHHFQWCLKQSEQIVNSGISNRSLIISNWSHTRNDEKRARENTKNSYLVPAVIGGGATILAGIIGAIISRRKKRA